MTTYFIARNVTATQVSPTNAGNPAGSQVAIPTGQTNPDTPAVSTQTQLNVTGIGTITATAQLWASNDDINYASGSPMQWSNLGSVTANGTNTATGGSNSSNTPWKYYTATISAISGSSASANVVLSA